MNIVTIVCTEESYAKAKEIALEFNIQDNNYTLNTLVDLVMTKCRLVTGHCPSTSHLHIRFGLKARSISEHKNGKIFVAVNRFFYTSLVYEILKVFEPELDVSVLSEIASAIVNGDLRHAEELCRWSKGGKSCHSV